MRSTHEFYPQVLLHDDSWKYHNDPWNSNNEELYRIRTNFAMKEAHGDPWKPKSIKEELYQIEAKYAMEDRMTNLGSP